MRILIILALAAGTAAAQPAGLTPALATVTFDIGSTQLAAGSADALRGVVSWAHDHPYRLLVVEGYADTVGTDAVNMALSQNRADVVRAELIHLGVDPHRLVDAAYGERESPGRRVVVRATVDDFKTLLDGQR